MHEPAPAGTVIVTGAAGGIGRATAVELDRAGMNLVAVDRDHHGLRRTFDSLQGSGTHQGVVADLSELAAIRSLIDGLRTPDPLVGVVHAAAALSRGRLARADVDDWRMQIDVNLGASVFLNTAAANRMVREGVGGAIVNFVSPVWNTGSSADADLYAISKAGVLTLTRSMARNYGPHGIRVNAISPGQIDTPMQREGNSAGALEAATAACPLGRMGRPEEVASVAKFLISEAASFVSGAVVPVTGGATPW